DVATRPDSHLELVQMAAERKVAILCQKPLAESLSAASQMVDLAEQNGVPLMVTENWRWLPLHRSVRHYIDEGRVGRPYAARIIGSSAMPRNRPVLRTQPYFADMPRLAIFEMGIHWIDCLRAMFGDVRRVYAQTRRVNPALAGEDVAKLMLSFDDAAVGLIDMSWACHDLTVPGEHLRVEGEQGALAGQLDGQVVMLNHFEARQAQQLPVLAQADSFDLLHAHFLDKLAAGQRDFVTSGRDNLNSLAAVFAAYESAETGQAIRLRAT
ncbi:MAG: Gfo/Idh/MocA family protein, partial [Phycisphaerae bacterium]